MFNKGLKRLKINFEVAGLTNNYEGWWGFNVAKDDEMFYV